MTTMTRKRRITAALGGLALAVSGLTATATTATAAPTAPAADTAKVTAQAASCYSALQLFSKPSGNTKIPSGNGWWKTTSRCQDINLKPGPTARSTYVRVCFQATGCQSKWTWLPAGSGWKVIASNVKDGSKYKFEFRTAAWWGGYRAN